nr:hypothetical protein [Jatrophihabitans endophyticus]
MGKYLVLIYESEDDRSDDPVRNAEYDKHWTFIAEHRAEIVAGEALQPTGTATCLRKQDDGAFAVTDGPFVETKGGARRLLPAGGRGPRRRGRAGQARPRALRRRRDPSDHGVPGPRLSRRGRTST